MTKDNDFIFGSRAIIEAIKANKTIDKILLKKGLNNDLTTELRQIAREYQIPTILVPEEKINRVTRKNHQGALAFISPIEFSNIEMLVPSIYEQGITPFFIILDNVTDVRNFGAICRTADAAGANGVIIPEKGSARINADAVKTSAGALHHIPVCRPQSLKKTVEFLQQSGIKVVAASEKTDNLYHEVDMNAPLAIVMGAEDTGVSTEIIRIADELVKIPMMGQIESLNVSVAAGVLMFEAVKQRQQ